MNRIDTFISNFQVSLLNTLRIIFRLFIIFLFICVLITTIIILYCHIVKGYEWADWTGFWRYHINKVDSKTNIVIEIEYYYRTLWDWIQLLFLPLLLTFGGLYFDRKQKMADLRAEEDRRVADEQNKDDIVLEYLEYAGNITQEYYSMEKSDEE